VDYVLPNVAKLLAKFRAAEAPVVWTNWVRTPGDGHYGALDRFYGPEGTTNAENPMYVYGKDATDTLPSLAPLNDDEYSRTIRSLHLSKFADRDARGELILYPLLKSWGVDTVVLTGAWTDDCILATVYDAVDKYDLDVVLVQDAVATATRNHGNSRSPGTASASSPPPTRSSISSTPPSTAPTPSSASPRLTRIDTPSSTPSPLAPRPPSPSPQPSPSPPPPPSSPPHSSPSTSAARAPRPHLRALPTTPSTPRTAPSNLPSLARL